MASEQDPMPAEPSYEEVAKIAEAVSVRWSKALSLMAKGACDGCPACQAEKIRKEAES